MNVNLLIVFQVSFFCSLIHAGTVIARPGALFDLPRLVEQSSKSVASFFALGAFIFRNAQEGIQVHEKAAKFGESLKNLFGSKDTFSRKLDDRKNRIQELRENIRLMRSEVSQNQTVLLEDLEDELVDLLTDPDAAYITGKTSSRSKLFSQENPGIISPVSNTGVYFVPGIREAAPKKPKNDKSSTSSQTQSGASEPAPVPAVAIATPPVGFSITINTPTGIPLHQIPEELKPLFFGLHSENLAIKAENEQLKRVCADFQQRLQHEMDRSASYERDHQQLLAQHKDFESEIKRLHEENKNLETQLKHLSEKNKGFEDELKRLHKENAALHLENEQLKHNLSETQERLLVTEKRLTKTEERLADTETRLNQIQYSMQIAESLNYVNKAVRKAFGFGPTGDGYVAIARKAKKNLLSPEQQIIWEVFINAHPHVEDPDVINLFKYVTEQRVQSAHPSVKKMTWEELFEGVKAVTEESDELVKKAVDLVWSFPV